jgi:hypothetical protein
VKHVMLGYEKGKVAIDLYKHFSTVSIAVPALSAAFLGNLSELANSTQSLLVAVVSFFVVIVCSSICKFIIVVNIEELPFGTFSHILLKWCSLFTFAGFFIGAGSFVYLILKNA